MDFTRARVAGTPPQLAAAPSAVVLLSSLLYISKGTNPRLPRDVTRLRGKFGVGNTVIGKQYFTRQATTLLKFAKSTRNPELAAVLIEKAAALKSQVDETGTRPDRSPLPPDVEPSD